MHKDPGIEAEVAKVRQGELVTSACAGSTRSPAGTAAGAGGRSGWSVSLSHPEMAESRGVTPVSDDHLEEGCHRCMCLEGESGTHRTEVSAVLGMASSVALF